ncbi:hypothetical protein GF337_17940 [candidate division KSB1 bacterium]|nr:hypothetical protein [candidate division KSB1 bacterium]
MEKHNQNKECKNIIEQLCEELNESVNSPFCTEVQRHLEQCSQCRVFVDSIRTTVFFCKNLVDEDVPRSIDDHLWKILKLKKPE